LPQNSVSVRRFSPRRIVTADALFLVTFLLLVPIPLFHRHSCPFSFLETSAINWNRITTCRMVL